MGHPCGKDAKNTSAARLERITRSCGGKAEAKESKKMEMREHRASGGKVQKGSTVNIVIAPQTRGQAAPEPEMRSGPVVPPAPPMPPGGAPMPPGPPMMRKRGGRV
jgi:hypothetical protein